MCAHIPLAQDRFHTFHFNPEGYTPWGFEHAKNNTLPDLINRHLGARLPRDMWLGKVPGATHPRGSMCCCCGEVPFDTSVKKVVPHVGEPK